jgi:hypothetical protein
MMFHLCRSFPLALLAISSLACPLAIDKQITDRTAILFHGTVTNLDSGATLLTFCGAEPDGPHAGEAMYAPYAKVVHFQAAAGTRVREDIQWEERIDRIEGPAPPQRDEAFWCAGGGAPIGPVSILMGWACKTAVPPDPAAIIEDVKPLGAVDEGAAQGYSLTLRVVHPGIVWTAFEDQCSLMQYHRTDPTQIGEATIDAP